MLSNPNPNDINCYVSSGNIRIYDFLEWHRRLSGFICGSMLFQTGKPGYYVVVNSTLPGLTATRNVLVKMRLQIFNQLCGSPRVIRGQTVNCPGVHLPSVTRNQKWHVTSEKWGLFSSWLTCLVCSHILCASSIQTMSCSSINMCNVAFYIWIEST